MISRNGRHSMVILTCAIVVVFIVAGVVVILLVVVTIVVVVVDCNIYIYMHSHPFLAQGLSIPQLFAGLFRRLVMEC